MFSGELRDMLVCRVNAASAVDHDDCDIGLLQSPHSLFDHCRSDALFPARETACVYDEIGYRTKLAKAVDAITCQTGIVRDQGVA